LSSAYIRAALVRAFSHIGGSSSNVPQAIVYAHPTIEALSNWLWKELTGTTVHTATERNVDASVAAMQNMIRGQLDILADRVRANRRPRVKETSGAVAGQAVKHAVLVTGTTGDLGAHLLETLLVDSSVDEVFALNRLSRSGGAEGVHWRHRTIFDKRGINKELLRSPKLTFIDADRVQDVEPDVISVVCRADIFHRVRYYCLGLTRGME
jgi:Male sterility protein